MANGTRSGGLSGGAWNPGQPPQRQTTVEVVMLLLVLLLVLALALRILAHGTGVGTAYGLPSAAAPLLSSRS